VKRLTSQEIHEFSSQPHFDGRIILNKRLSLPRISIVTPSYNQGQFIERTILSVLNQNYPNLEYIIIDGGSTDGSVEIIKKYERYLAYWVSEKDNGQADAINKGFKMATGDLVGWQNSDDIYLPGAFEKVVQVFSKFPNISIVFGSSLMIDVHDNKIGENMFTPFSVINHFYGGTSSINNQGCFWRSGMFSRIGMLDTQFHFSMDSEFFLRAGVKREKFKYVHSFLACSRIHKDSKSSTIPWVSMNNHKTIETIYGKKASLGFILKTLSVMRGIIYYFIQGDWGYVVNGFKKRVKLISDNMSKKIDKITIK
jgi:glycosyltransferase involved in cell wall biosynthesis